MKIAIMMPSLCMCGAERVAITLANWLSKKGEEVYLISLSAKEESYEISKKVKVFYKNYDLSKMNKKGVIKKIIKLKYMSKYAVNTLRKIEPDIIFEMLYIPLFFAIIYKKIYNNKVVIIGSERNNPKKYDTKLRKFLSWISPKFCDGYIFQTNIIKNMFSKRIQNKSVVINNAISNNYVEEINNTSQNIRKNKVISNMSKLYEKQKGQEVLIKAFKKVNEKYKDYKLVIYGEGNDRKKLERLINDIGLKGKVLLPGKDKKALFKIAQTEIFVMSSRYEGMPNALLEAMAIGMPCISTDCVAGPAEIIKNNINGILVPVDDIDEMANKIIYLIENKKIAKEMGERAKKVNNKFSIDKIYSEYEEFFNKVYMQKKKV